MKASYTIASSRPVIKGIENWCNEMKDWRHNIFFEGAFFSLHKRGELEPKWRLKSAKILKHGNKLLNYSAKYCCCTGCAFLIKKNKRGISFLIKSYSSCLLKSQLSSGHFGTQLKPLYFLFFSSHFHLNPPVSNLHC